MWINQKGCKKMKKIIYLLISITFLSCSTPKKENNSVFDKYIEEYTEIIGDSKYKSRLKYVNISFDNNMESGVVGICYWGFLNKKSEIKINKKWWDITRSETSKRFLLFHELEHCIRYRLHSNTKQKIENFSDFLQKIFHLVGLTPKDGHLYDGCPSSIMHSHMFGRYCQTKHYNYYILEIKNWEKTR